MSSTYQTALDAVAGRAELAAIKARVTEQVMQAIERTRGHQPTDAERFQATSNAHAELHPRYAAARVAALYGPVIPLEPEGVEPLAEPAEATRDDRAILDWWRRFPNANPGVACGKPGNLVVLRVTGEQGATWLRALLMAPVHSVTDEFGDTYQLGTPRNLYDFAGRLVHTPPPSPAFQSFAGSAKQVQRAYAAHAAKHRAARTSHPRGYYVAWPTTTETYTEAGTDHHGHPVERETRRLVPDPAWTFPTRTLAPGVEVCSDGQVLPWAGSVLADGTRVDAYGPPPQPMPTWLAEALGSRTRRLAIGSRASRR